MLPTNAPNETQEEAITPQVLKHRTKQLAVRTVKLCRSLAKKADSRVITNQLVRSATSVAANYRAVCRVRSKKEFIAKLGIVVEEADETLFWLEMLVELGDVSKPAVWDLMKETNRLTAIFVSSKRTATKADQPSTVNRQPSTA